MQKLKVYIARPINGYSYDEVANYYDTMSRLLSEMGFQVFHPLVGKQALRTETEFKAHGYGNPESTNHAIKERDQWMVRTSDIVLVDLAPAKTPSIGCVCELAWADILGKHSVVIMGENNPNYHAFVLEMADIVFPLLAQALEYMESLIQ